MRKIFGRKQKQSGHYDDLPDYVSELPQTTTDKIMQLFLSISSLTERLQQYQTQRRLKESRQNTDEILDILHNELNVANSIERKYRKIKSYFTSIKQKNKELSTEILDHIQQKNIMINKEIETIHQRQRYLISLIENKNRNQ